MESQPLWDVTNNTMFSSIFNVPEGKACILFATGLEGDKVKATDTEFTTPQTFCVHKLLLASQVAFSRTATCEWIANPLNAEIIADEVVDVCGCWEMTQDRNIAIIGLPGVYRLALNDNTMVGVAQVYASLVALQDLHYGTSKLFF